jgi:two-component sensor histidine kinase
MIAVRVACLLAMLGYTALFALVFQRARQRRASRYFLLYLLAMIIWQGSQTAVAFTTDAGVALGSYRFMVALGYSFGLFYTMFVRELVGVRSGNWIVWFGYASIVAVPAYMLSGLPGMVDGVYQHAEIPLYLPEFGLVATASGALVYGFLTYAFFLLARAQGSSTSIAESNRLLYLMIGMVILIIGSALNFSPQLRPYPLDTFANLINAGLTALAILRYQLFDIRVVVRKGLRYSVITGIVAIIYFLLVFLSIQVLHFVAGYQVLLLSLVMAAVAAVVVQPLRDLLQARVDRRFFRERYDVAQMLQRLTSRSAALLNVEDLTNLIVAEVTDTMHIERAAFFLMEPQRGYRMVASRGLADGDRAGLRDDHPILEWLAKHPQIFSQNQLELLPLWRALQMREREQWERLGAEVVAPIVSKEVLIGLLTVGRKKSDMEYSADDRSALLTLANQAAVAVENARLYSAVQQQLAEREQTERLLLQSLHEKEVLLREIHHRVKNNLQVIYSLLSLQSQYAPDQPTLEVLRDSQNRIRSMALIHEKLYQSANMADIDIGEYLRTLSAHLHRSYFSSDRNVRIVVSTAPIRLPLDVALPCALIASELISNALKHAFVGRSEGVLRVVIEAEERGLIQLEVSDDGIGIPASAAEPELVMEPATVVRSQATLGMQLVRSLVRQLDAELTMTNRLGTRFVIVFRAPTNVITDVT